MKKPIGQTPPARPGPITDQQLEHAITAAEELQGDWRKLDPRHFIIFMNLISVTAAPIYRECLAHRRQMDVINDFSDRGRVTLLT